MACVTRFLFPAQHWLVPVLCWDWKAGRIIPRGFLGISWWPMSLECHQKTNDDIKARAAERPPCHVFQETPRICLTGYSRLSGAEDPESHCSFRSDRDPCFCGWPETLSTASLCLTERWKPRWSQGDRRRVGRTGDSHLLAPVLCTRGWNAPSQFLCCNPTPDVTLFGDRAFKKGI